MNLHSMVSGLIGAINPPQLVIVRRSAGSYSTAADGTRTPNYLDDEYVKMQVQIMTNKELQQTNEMNIGGILKKVYANGSLSSIDRKAQKGGDLVVIEDDTWLVVHILEQWSDWVCAVIQKQVY